MGAEVFGVDLLGVSDELFKLICSFFFNSDLVHVRHLRTNRILAEEVADQDVFDVVLFAMAVDFLRCERSFV